MTADALAALLVLPLALALDLRFGEPPARVHPVCAMGAMAVAAETAARGVLRCPVRTPGAGACPADRGRAGREFLAGVLAGCAVLAAFTIPPAVLAGLAAMAHPLAGALAAAACVWLCMAPSSLDRHARRVLAPLAAGRLDRARAAVSMIVGRETRLLDAHGVARACVESVAENFTDGVLASVLWAVLGFAAFGLPGAAALPFLQRAANTLDAMWGRKDDRYRRFGTFGARADDLLGWPAARVALPLVALAALVTRRCDAAAALTVGWRYRRAHESPNSAWSEAAFAGALGLSLGGPAVYAGRRVDHPVLGEGTPHAGPAHIGAALDLMWSATLLAVAAGALTLAVLA